MRFLQLFDYNQYQKEYHQTMKTQTIFKLITAYQPFSQSLTRELILSTIKAILKTNEFMKNSKPKSTLQTSIIQEILNLIQENKNMRDSIKGSKFYGQKEFYQPQFSQQQKYQQAEKIYKLGIMSFTMLSGNPPFENSNNADPYYSLIFENNWEQFWQQHHRKRTEQFYSHSYRQFFQTCICQCLKLSLTELLNQDWFQIESQDPELIRKQVQKITQKKQLIKSKNKKQQFMKNIQYQRIINRQPERLRQFQQNQRFLEMYYEYKYNSEFFEETSVSQIKQKQFNFLVQEKTMMAIPIFVEFVENLIVPIETVHQDVLGQQPYYMKCEICQNISKDMFEIHLSYTYGTQTQELVKSLILNVQLKTFNESIVFFFRKQQGNIFYFSRVFNLIKDRFQYCQSQQSQ